MTLPAWLFSLFSTSLTFTMNATTLMLIVLAFASTVSWFVRYRFLNMYARLPPEPQRKEPEIDIFPDTQEGDSKPGLANYLDEFLSAIKVFGYLERPVFHELTRTMQTRKMRAGETLLLEEEKGFCLVVDGLVQIFVKSGRKASDLGSEDSTAVPEHDEDDEDEASYGKRRQGYSLLTEVKNGAPMSSLFSILSLFTEDVQLRHKEDEDEGVDAMYSPGAEAEEGRTTSARRGETPPVSGSSPRSPIVVPQSSTDQTFVRDRSSSLYTNPPLKRRLQDVPPFLLESRHQSEYVSGDASGDPHPVDARQPSHRVKSVHPDILARATVDTTIAIIPASAFRRLTRVYPKATAHIVQVILTRLQRVTLATGHSYLGLTSEILGTEKKMNAYTAYDLPNFLRGDALNRLKQKLLVERERVGPEEVTKGIALHNGRGGHRRRASGSRRSRVAEQAMAASARTKAANSLSDGRVESFWRSDRNLSRASPGDLLSDAQLSRHVEYGRQLSPSRGLQHDRFWQGLDLVNDSGQSPLGQHGSSPFVPSPDTALHRQESIDEDGVFRASVLECILKAIGLAKGSYPAPRSWSGEQSPQLVSYDSKRQVAVFTNAFGMIDPYEGPADADTESHTSAPLSTHSAAGPYSSTGLEEEFRDDIEIVYFPKGSVLVEQGERNPGLYYVIDGFLDVGMPVETSGGDADTASLSPDLTAAAAAAAAAAADLDQRKRPAMAASLPSSARAGHSKRARRKNQGESKSLFLIKPGGIAGYIGTISSYRSFIDVKAKTDVYVGFLPRKSLERVVERFPIVLLTMAKRLTTLLPRLILHIDFALEWVQVNAGQVIYHQKEESDAIYIVLNGRLRLILEKDGGEMRALGEFGQGESVGELEVLTDTTRPGTLHAIRDTELAKFPKSLFNTLALEHPGITIQISKIIASRMRTLVEDRLIEAGDRTATVGNKRANSTMNLRTVAILPVTAGVPVVDFGSRLTSALTHVGTPNGVTSLTQATILNHLGRHAFNRMGKLKLSQYLADLEEKYSMVIYVADTNVNAPWTQTCISQADCILLVGLAEASPDMGEYERLLLGMKTTARKELVLLHVDRYSPPGLTRKWLRNRMWINGGHHHVQMAFPANAGPVHPQIRRLGLALKQRVQILQSEIQKYTSRKVRQTPVYSPHSQWKGDFPRLARRLCGKSVGLVLGGGGARGIAHIGIIRALEEAGIPVDIVGGTSIGAFIGALYARDADIVPMYGRAKKFAGRMGSVWRFALDLTYPTASYTTGHEFNRGIFKTFGDSQIEDLWIEFYCNTTNISNSRPHYHSSGYVWRYVRASMSLAGLLPPLCDEGNMLLDGGYIDNLTVAHMRSLGADFIFAVDVGSINDDQPQAFGDSLSGFWALINRWNPLSSHANPPTLSEIQARLAYVSSVDALERAKTTPGCIYMRPPIDAFGTLDFAKFAEIYQVGYDFGKAHLAQLRDRGILPMVEETEEKRKLRRTMAPRRASI
ncbi:MAG: phosphatidylcholine and lysophosphatidylcholine phospholipase [Lichina confinis]|nr:MAG: phosphatidylcholine and lysophosphatidylcholine phospholipase [Lichina confinis]